MKIKVADKIPLSEYLAQAQKKLSELRDSESWTEFKNDNGHVTVTVHTRRIRR